MNLQLAAHAGPKLWWSHRSAIYLKLRAFGRAFLAIVEELIAPPSHRFKLSAGAPFRTASHPDAQAQSLNETAALAGEVKRYKPQAAKTPTSMWFDTPVNSWRNAFQGIGAITAKDMRFALVITAKRPHSPAPEGLSSLGVGLGTSQ